MVYLKKFKYMWLVTQFKERLNNKQVGPKVLRFVEKLAIYNRTFSVLITSLILKL